jgi:hypothetical protein
MQNVTPDIIFWNDYNSLPIFSKYFKKDLDFKNNKQIIVQILYKKNIITCNIKFTISCHMIGHNHYNLTIFTDTLLNYGEISIVENIKYYYSTFNNSKILDYNIKINDDINFNKIFSNINNLIIPNDIIKYHNYISNKIDTNYINIVDIYETII